MPGSREARATGESMRSGVCGHGCVVTERVGREDTLSGALTRCPMAALIACISATPMSSNGTDSYAKTDVKGLVATRDNTSSPAQACAAPPGFCYNMPHGFERGAHAYALVPPHRRGYVRDSLTGERCHGTADRYHPYPVCRPWGPAIPGARRIGYAISPRLDCAR
jgi:hypothetical protein